jgi:hypothetical protein
MALRAILISTKPSKKDLATNQVTFQDRKKTFNPDTFALFYFMNNEMPDLHNVICFLITLLQKQTDIT